MENKRSFVDAHVHLYDNRLLHYSVFERKDPTFEALVGDYSRLPKTYLLDEYLRTVSCSKLEGIVWHEFISEDASKEVIWAGKLLTVPPSVPIALVGLVDFSDPALSRKLDTYLAIPNLTAVRQHLGWDDRHPLRRMAPRSNFMTDPAWLRGLKAFGEKNLRCGLEVFAPQLPELVSIVRQHPSIDFTIAVMGWPTDLDSEGHAHWRRHMSELGKCGNTCASISAIECIFGMDWNEEQIEPWIASVIEAFGPARCMFGSHLPITSLSHGFDRLFEAYERIVATLSEAERDAIFRTTALSWFRMGFASRMVDTK
jgi:predicted TIM-barrel fold metal-dependent hydrolase